MTHLYAPLDGTPSSPIGAPMVPPASWFDDLPPGWNPLDNLDDPVIYVDSEGRFASLVAPYGVCLLERARFQGECWTAPLSQTDYQWAHAGKTTAVLEADGQAGKRHTANIAADIPHANSSSTVQGRRHAFDNTSHILARGTYVDRPDLGGIFILGALVPTATRWDGLRLQASALSGEFFPRPDLRELELIGSIVVNEPGFRRQITRRTASFKTASLESGAVVGTWKAPKTRVRLAASAVPPKKPKGSVLVALPAAGQWTDGIEEAHVTLAYVPGDRPEGIPTLVAAAEGGAAMFEPFEATVAATGKIGSEDAAAVFLNSDVFEKMHDWTCNDLAEGGVEQSFPNFFPHMTTGYGTEPIEHDPTLVVKFDRFAVWIGGRERREFTLSKVSSIGTRTRVRVKKGVGDARR